MKNRTSGFTLLEMMLTVGLIALTATFVGLNIGQSDAKLAELEAKRFVALLNLAQDESIVTGRPVLLTLDIAAHGYHFAPLGAPQALADQDEEQTKDAADAPVLKDDFYKQRTFPEVVKIEYSRLPDLIDETEDTGFVPKRVHEILNQSMFDREDSDESEAITEEAILIEPNGLVSPFSLTLTVEDHVARVGLDRFGRAALVDVP